MSEPEKIHPAIIAIMRAIGPIAKSSRNEQQKYNFRGVDAIYNACHPHLAEHGVYCTSEILDAQHTTKEVTTKTGRSSLSHAILRMRFTYRAEDGSSVSTEVVGEGMDYNGDKASNKAMSVADKYALLQLLKIPVAMADPDKHDAPEPREDAPRQQPRVGRVKGEWLVKIADLWYSNNADMGEEDWRNYVSKIVTRDFNRRKPDLWEMDEYEALRDAVNAEVGNGPIPF